MGVDAPSTSAARRVRGWLTAAAAVLGLVVTTAPQAAAGPPVAPAAVPTAARTAGDLLDRLGLRAVDLRVLPVPPGALNSYAYDFTDDGAVHGVIEVTDGHTVEVLWVDGGEPVPWQDPCADSRQVQVTDHLPAGLRERWPDALGTVVLDECPPAVVRTPRGGPGYVLGGNGKGVHVGFGLLAGTFYQDPVAWVHGLAVPLGELRGADVDGAVALDVSDEGLVVGYQRHRWQQGDTHPWQTAVAWWLAPSDPRR